MNGDTMLVINESALRRVIHEEVTSAVDKAVEDIRQQATGTYTVKEACSKLRVSAPTIYKKINDGILHPVKFGKRTLFRALEIDNLISTEV